MQELRGRVAVVTGGASGIGKALATRFKAEGTKQIVAVDLNEAGVNATADELSCIAMAADVSSEADILRVSDRTEDNVGPIDLCCSNAVVGLGAGAYFANAGVLGFLDGEHQYLHRILDAVMFRVEPLEKNRITGYVDLSGENDPHVEVVLSRLARGERSTSAGSATTAKET